jgi:hypothetical protein
VARPNVMRDRGAARAPGSSWLEASPSGLSSPQAPIVPPADTANGCPASRTSSGDVSEPTPSSPRRPARYRGAVGKASKRKSRRRRGTGQSRADFERRRGLAAMAAAIRPVLHEWDAREEREEQARRYWRDGAVQRPAVIPRWAEDSVGDRFFSGKWLMDAAGAPVIADAKLPGPAVLASDPGHWEAAISALFRGVVLDAVPVDDSVVSEVLSMLEPVVVEELARADETGAPAEEWDLFQELNAPLFMVGGYALIEGTWAILGLDPVEQVLAVVERVMHDALAEAGYAEGTDGKIIAGTLINALTDGYRFEEPGDVETLERFGRGTSGNVLLDLIRAKQVEPGDALRLGLVILAALASLARTDAKSVLSELDG